MTITNTGATALNHLWRKHSFKILLKERIPCELITENGGFLKKCPSPGRGERFGRVGFWTFCCRFSGGLHHAAGTTRTGPNGSPQSTTQRLCRDFTRSKHFPMSHKRDVLYVVVNLMVITSCNSLVVHEYFTGRKEGRGGKERAVTTLAITVLRSLFLFLFSVQGASLNFHLRVRQIFV